MYIINVEPKDLLQLHTSIKTEVARGFYNWYVIAINPEATTCIIHMLTFTFPKKEYFINSIYWL